MRLILTDERANFDTIGAMLGTFLLHSDSVLLLPENRIPAVTALLSTYYFKLPFEPRTHYQDAHTGQLRFEQVHEMVFGFDYLQSLQVAGQLMAQARKLDAFYASVLLLGIYATANRLDSFSVVDEATLVSSYLLDQGADESFVETWLGFSTPAQSPDVFPVFETVPVPADAVFWKSIPVWHTLMEKVVSQVTRKMNFPLYAVGGYVRDLLRGGSSPDLDFIVEGDAIPVARALANQYGGKLTLHPAFGTARWDFQQAIEKILKAFPAFDPQSLENLPESMDLISARTEWYLEAGQLPKVRKSTIQLDLRRRDFTVNTLGIRLDQGFGMVLDCCGGLQDLENKIIRALHPRSFIDDPTRMFRAVRYEQRLDFHIEGHTLEWMRAAYGLLELVSGDRIRHELNLMLDENQPQDNFQRLSEIGLMTALHPDWQWRDELAAVLLKVAQDSDLLSTEQPANGNLTARQMAGYLILFGGLSAEALDILTSRLLFSTQQKRLCLTFNDCVQQIAAGAAISPGTWTNVLDRLDETGLFALSCLLHDHTEAQTALAEYRSTWKGLRPTLTGDDFRLMGIAPGPLYGELLEKLRAAWLDGGVQDEADERRLLAELLREAGVQE